MRELVLATANGHKVEELRAILHDLPVQVLGLADLGISLREPEETGKTFAENALIKARSYAAQTGKTCVADDSGMEIAALGGKPGVISSHFCTDGRQTGMTRAERDAANNAKVLTLLEGVAAEKREARFVCVMVVAEPGNPLPLTVCGGVFAGRIGVPPQVPRGESGFGYDPLFLVGPEFELTSAELSAAEKNSLSHRGQAAAELARWVRTQG